MDQNSNLNLTPAIWSINNYNYPGTTCIITIICQFFFETSKKKFIHQIAGVRLRLEFWSKLEKPPKQFSQSYFGKKNKVETLFSGQNLEIPWFFLAFLLIFFTFESRDWRASLRFTWNPYQMNPWTLGYIRVP